MNKKVTCKYFNLLPLLSFVLSLLLTISSWQLTRQAQSQKEELLLENETVRITTLIKDRIRAYEQVLLGGAAFFYSSKNINRNDWRTYIEKQNLQANFNCLQGIGFAEAFRADELVAHEAKVRADGFPTYSVKPEGKRDFYTSVVYLEPCDIRNQKAFGYDMFSEQTRREAMQKAIDSGKPTLSGKVKLIQDNGKDEQAGFLMYVPIYKQGSTSTTPEERMSNVRGFVYAPFNANVFMTWIMEAQTDAIDIKLYDGATANPSQLMFDSHPNNPKETISSKIITMNIDGRQWTLKLDAHKEAFAEISSNAPLIALIGGLLASFLLYALVYMLVETRSKALKLAEQMTDELRESKERWELAIAGSGDGVWDWNIETGATVFDKQWKAMIGFEENEFENSFEAWKSRIHPDDLEIIYKTLNDYFEGKIKYYNVEHRLKCKDGSYKWILARGIVAQRNADGKPIRMTGTHTDIHFKKTAQERLEKSEQRFRSLFEGHKAMMYLVDPQTGILTEVNNAAASFYGYEQGELNGQHISKIHTWSKEQIDEAKKKAASVPQTHFILQHRLKSGEIRDMEIFTSPVEIDGSKLLFSIIFDVTERIEAQAQLKLLNENLQAKVEEEITKRMEIEADRQKERAALIQSEKMAQLGNMLGVIIHQWKQPLNMIALDAQEIRECYQFNELDEDMVNKMVDSIMSQVKFMSTTADDFRDFYKPSREKKHFSLVEQVESVEKLLSKQLKLSKITVNMEGDPSICANGCTGEFRQVLLNIINNAKDAFEEREIENPKIDISVDSDGTTSTLVISDNAGGIPSYLLPDKLFEAFESTKGDCGTGIGLSLSKTIIEENMSGSISVQNVDGGARFTIKLPIAK